MTFPPPAGIQASSVFQTPSSTLARKPTLSAAENMLQRLSGDKAAKAGGSGGGGGGGGFGDTAYDSLLRRVRDELEQQGLLGPESL